MSCTRSPPSSPRAPKIQQQSWDDCNTPPIDLFDPNQHSPPHSPMRLSQPPKSPKSPRKFDKKINCYYEQTSKSPKSPRKFDFNSPKFDYSIEDEDEPQKQKQINRSWSKGSNGPGSGGTSGSGGGGTYYEQRSPKYYDKSPKSPRKFEYDAISPKYEKAKKFEHFDMTHTDEQSMPHKPFLKMMKKQKSSSSTPPGSEKNFSQDGRGNVIAESSMSGESEATTAILSSSSGIGGSVCISGNGSDRIVSGNCPEPIEICDGDQWTNTRRRHAINITSNPGYQVLHSSHSTLDRTCSDGVMSVKVRKSTSDLANVGVEKPNPIAATPRRRGSSKGGLAYLASRRGSRESMKSAVSNSSIFSNEDIGPLTFQSSQRGRQRRTSNFLELPVPDHIRPRVCSLPERPYNPRQSDDLYRLRTFSISKGTVVNCGDSIISRRSRSNTSVNSTTSRASERSPFDGSCCGGGYATVDSLPPSPTDSEPPPPPRYRVVMLGDSGVGKTALVSQFMTSEYMHTYDASLDDEFGEKTVSILLDGEESEMIFIDHPSHEMSVENSLSTYEPHGCVVIYSVVARSSFRVAEQIINYLWSENVTRDKAVILVGNKADLARSRAISTAEGKALAASRDAKFIETSSGIQHNVDELLVGILKQIRLKETRDKKHSCSTSKMRNSKTHLSLHLAKEILQKICLSDISKSKSCENLHVL